MPKILLQCSLFEDLDLKLEIIQREGLAKMMTKCDIEGRGSGPRSNVTPSKKYCFNNLNKIDL